ncbi:hypothetical protein AAF712_014768 [Marasmius tenuissimus]|uniref:Uncharacterized protein n=1 Tax=Marasmius tenuissimus TaxID=585030 RepID=A0ABR2ZA52_9AGAR
MGLEDAEHAWYVLIEHNSKNYNYYRGYLDNLGVNTEEDPVQAVKILYKKFITQLPKANTPKRLALLITPASFAGDESAYPPFADVELLYGDQEKMKIVEEIVKEVKREHITTDPSSSSEPITYFWTLYSLAQHHSHLGHHTMALSLLDEATAHTPTLPELYIFRAPVLKRAGDPIHAAGAMEEARLLDGQDCLRQEAEKVLGLFTKKDTVSPGFDLEDMQSLLYLMEITDSHLAGGTLHMALKKYVAVQNLLNKLEDDQYDFHGYSLRKFNIYIYLNLLSWEDRLQTQPAYIKAAVAASRIRVSVHDNPSLKSHSGGNSSSKGKLSEAEAKVKKKAKKATQKEARGQEEKDKKVYYRNAAEAYEWAEDLTVAVETYVQVEKFATAATLHRQHGEAVDTSCRRHCLRMPEEMTDIIVAQLDYFRENRLQIANKLLDLVDEELDSCEDCGLDITRPLFGSKRRSCWGRSTTHGRGSNYGRHSTSVEGQGQQNLSE